MSGIKNHFGSLTKALATQGGRNLVSAEVNKIAYLKAYAEKVDDNLRWKALEQAIAWFLHNQKQMADDGFGSFYLSTGWTSSYPETTGYIVPTLLRYATKTENEAARESAKKALDWLVKIQKPEGGWQGGYVHQNRPAVVFNTGQIIRGMLAGHAAFQNPLYLEAAKRAADWLVQVQSADGSFTKNVYLDVARVYDSYVVAPVLQLNKISPNEAYVAMARKNLDWIIKQKQRANGWFEDCDNTIHKNQKPIIHTLAYTIDGLLDSGLLLKEPKYISAAKKPADRLRDKFLKNGKLSGRYNWHWRGSEPFITTGGAQLAIIWYKLYRHTNEELYQLAYTKMNAHLVAMQQRPVHESADTRGALFGSFPLWGRYEAFACPNWATKYLADSLMNEAGYP
jgi:hypothetical protein